MSLTFKKAYGSTPLETMVRFHFQESTCCYLYDEGDDVAYLNIECNGDKFLEKMHKNWKLHPRKYYYTAIF